MRKEHASCRVWTKREEKERRMVLRISRGEEKKCISSIFVPVCSLMEVVGMLKNMREKGYSERFFCMIVILDIIWKLAKFGLEENVRKNF